MSMHERRLAAGLLLGICVVATAGEPGPRLGKEMTAAEIADADFVVMPDGDGLPEGAGNAASGEAVYRAHCIACHGEKGQDGVNDALAGGRDTIRGPMPNKTVGSYWPYATTLFDYIRRSMPYPEPGTLTNDELYAVTAYILHINGIVAASETIDAQSLPRVKMPNRDHFEPMVEP